MQGQPKADQDLEFLGLRFEHFLAEGDVLLKFLHVIVVDVLEFHIFQVD